jgi:hypothetical protein
MEYSFAINGEVVTRERMMAMRSELTPKEEERKALVFAMRTRALTAEESARAMDYGNRILNMDHTLARIESVLMAEQTGWAFAERQFMGGQSIDEKAFHALYLQQAKLRAIDRMTIKELLG